MFNFIKTIKLAAVAVGAMAITSCGDDEKSTLWKSEDKIKVVATTTMVADMVKNIGGDEVEVIGLMGEGIDPHSYEAKNSDTAALKTADVVFYSGLHLEGSLHGALHTMSDQGKAWAVTDKMDKAKFIKPADELEKYSDPHVWGDPILWATGVDAVVEGLSKQNSAKAADFKKRGEAYKAELVKLNTWAKTRLAEIPAEQRVLITSHDAFAYYARAFEFEVRAMDGLAPGDKGSQQKITALIEFIKAKKIKMIFPESAMNKKGIEAVAQDAGVALSKHELFADATGKHGEMETVNGETYDVGTYIGMMKHNVNTIVEGLK